MKMKSIKSLVLTKQKIRSKILKELKIQKEEDRNRKSQIIKEKLFTSSVFKKAKKVMFYVSFGGEVDTKNMIKEAQNLGKVIAVPVCTENRTLIPCRLGKKTKLKKGPYAIHQPVVKRCISLKDIDLVIVPGVAFDKKGRRLGRGKGYYDRFLEGIPKKIASVGLAFDFQILPSVPTNAMDVDVNQVVFA